MKITNSIEKNGYPQLIQDCNASTIKDLNSFDFPPYIKKINFSSLFSLLPCRRECPCKKMLFSLLVKHVGGNCWHVQVKEILERVLHPITGKWIMRDPRVIEEGCA